MTSQALSKTLCFQLVGVFSGIIGRKITLIHSKDKPPKIEGDAIHVDLDSEDAYPLVEHEISHIVFESNATLREAFTKEYTTKISIVCEQNNAQLDELEQLQLRQTIRFLISVLDDERVLSLWGALYPGTEQILREIRHKEAEEILSNSSSSHNLRSNIMTLVWITSRGCLISGEAHKRYTAIIEKALQKVRFRDYPGVLVVCKWMITQLVKEVIRASKSKTPNNTSMSPSRTKSEALKVLLDNIGIYTPKTEEAIQEIKVPSWQNNLTGSNDVETLINQSVSDQKLEEFLKESTSKMRKVVAKIRNATSQPSGSEESICRDARSEVTFSDSINLNVVEVSPEEKELARRLRIIFMRIKGRRAYSLSEEGSEISVPEFLQRRLTLRPLPVFKQSLSSRGLTVLILLDRSKSMLGEKTILADRACRILSMALTLPNVTVSVWGFYGPRPGAVRINRSDNGMFGGEPASQFIAGTTPLHEAVRVASRFLDTKTNKKHLFVISDGRPVFQKASGTVYSTKSLIEFVRSSIRNSRKRGIGVTGITIGSDMPDSKMNRMYGPSHNWKRIEEPTLDTDLIEIISQVVLKNL